MRIDPGRARTLLENLQHVAEKVNAAKGNRPVRLIAVSKLKPATDILALHHPPSSDQSDSSKGPTRPHHFDFGENYAQELTEKAGLLPRTIRWHMIGALQTNKCKALAESVPNLFCVASVDSAKKADALNKGRKACLEPDDSDRRLRILVQVNTSGEESKSGVSPDSDELLNLCRHIHSDAESPHLRLAGLMTIGAIARSRAAAEGEENEDFVKLRDVRSQVAKALEIPEDELALSMGMSADFEAALGMGSDEVRVGTGIFGERPPKDQARVV
ncbi:alanine racemase family protein [Dissoconium aciculare CBS 342.82]|uniref:Pyridoxal phosphate homeostasis protein n=1 Tax=Dissoconium aciculare CBS 342.82 TaxID=1314786 RepID=A0A6J3M7V5_9PEZI|nr:alanine racemase family protein [Dissoconium aciculare CBS 342.82]KAF1824080.1 alanine racemase family protein [Dissoconium aciculare CBS 342.82]